MSKVKRLYSFIKNSVKKAEVPGIVNFEITAKCNLKCEHCYMPETSSDQKELSGSEWEQIFSNFSKKGVRSAFLTGGEPALRLDIVRSAYNTFKSISIVSNGTIPIPKDIQTRIFISIDGPEEIHNQIRGRDVYSKVMENIRGDKRIVLTPTLSATNYRNIDDLVRIAKEADVEGITFSTYTSHDAGNDPLLLTGEAIDYTVSHLFKVWNENRDIVFLSPNMIKLFKTKKFYRTCYLRNRDKAISFDPQLKQKNPCVLGEGVECSTCGCIVPITAYAMAHADIRSWLLFDKLYPERYYK